ncbi:OmpA family protein [Spirosoma utsteinense]|uniref:OOP family OmpA-OmpF porin n=1 Tax=Spirosoma utsteinense TaxID=2585773 RepID=A0ABR6W629_9BACT|nr:OmpA family protein [Spirosoma utsteinense]MBC3785828.1 OOP family OmpA-OmpF porin [Spirosoma utsteinense]MBC3792000.1 OOP family OmpA-OmpF porin [Spirosoma utsteinense]
MFSSKTPWIILLALWMVGSTWWHVCKIKQLCANDEPAVTAADNVIVDDVTPMSVATNGLTIADGDRFQLDLPGNFSFARSGSNANMNTLGTSLDSLAAYLKANPGRTLTVTGFYGADEANVTSFANLGLARAEGVKQYLIQQGIPAVSLSTAGETRSGKDGSGGMTFTSKGDSLYGGIDFTFDGVAPGITPVTGMTDSVNAKPPVLAPDAPTTEAGLAAAEKYTSVFEPIDLYFTLGEATYIKTPETSKFFSEAIKYLSTHKDKKLRLTGHTDNSGPDATNLQLSRDRANQVKGRLRKSGIDSDQIVVDAKGETAPKVSNDTREGRKANRRVTVVVQ